MTVAAERNGHHRFDFVVTRTFGVELCKMLALENIALYEGNEYEGDFCLSGDAIRCLQYRCYIYSKLVEGNALPTYFLTPDGVCMALLVFRDLEVKRQVQLRLHEFVVHPDTIRLRILQEDIRDRVKTVAAKKKRHGK